MTDRLEARLGLLEEIVSASERVPRNLRKGALAEKVNDLRTALEAQRDELDKVESGYVRLTRNNAELKVELAQAHARIARLEDGLGSAKRDLRRAAMSGPDTGHYPAFHEVCELLAEHPRQSAAALKAEALREAADAYEAQPDDFKWTPGSFLNQRADRIEREAQKES